MHPSHFACRRAAAILLSVLLLTTLGFRSANAGTDQRLELADGDGAPQLVFKADEKRVLVQGPDGQPLLRGKQSNPFKRKYSLPDGTAVAVAKGDADGFKLKDPDGALLWKVKRDGDRIKISDNEENADAAILRRRGTDKWELEQDDQSLGKIKRYPDTGKIKVKDYANVTRYQVVDGPFTPAAMVLLLDRVPRDQAYAVLAECWLRGW